jgi:hypothetical protein
MPCPDGLSILGLVDHDLNSILELVGDVLAILDSGVLLDLLLGDSHSIGGSMTAIIENMMFELFAEPDLCGLGLGRVSLPAAGLPGTAATATASTTVGLAPPATGSCLSHP